MFPFNGRAIQALKIVEASFNVSVFFDTQLYANDLADVIERGEKINNTNAVKLDSEMKRCANLKTVESTLSQIRRRRARGTSGLWPSSP